MGKKRTNVIETPEEIHKNNAKKLAPQRKKGATYSKEHNGRFSN